MEELDLRHAFKKVQAPPGFEQLVLARIREARTGATAAQARPVGRRLALAGGLAILLAAFVMVNIFVLRPGGGPAGLADDRLETGATQAGVVPVMDRIDYGREVRTVSGELDTVYILEQVSDSGTYADIIY